MVDPTPWSHQPRWPKGTPSGPKGPGAGRWRGEGGAPHLPEIGSHVTIPGGIRGTVVGHHHDPDLGHIVRVKDEHGPNTYNIRHDLVQPDRGSSDWAGHASDRIAHARSEPAAPLEGDDLSVSAAHILRRFQNGSPTFVAKSGIWRRVSHAEQKPDGRINLMYHSTDDNKPLGGELIGADELRQIRTDPPGRDDWGPAGGNFASTIAGMLDRHEVQVSMGGHRWVDVEDVGGGVLVGRAPDGTRLERPYGMGELIQTRTRRRRRGVRGSTQRRAIEQ